MPKNNHTCQKVPPRAFSVVDWFQPTYESVFAVLHPFVAGPPAIMAKVDSEEGPTREDVKSLKTVRWETVARLTGAESLGALHSWLLTSIGAANYSSPEAVAIFRDELERAGIQIPEEGTISPLVLDPILEIFLEAGYGKVLVFDEFCSNRRVLDTRDLLNRKYPVLPEAHPVLTSPDGALLSSVEWDSFYSFLCGSKSQLQHQIAQKALEGFFFEPGMTVHWGAPSPISLKANVPPSAGSR